jgi:hypothetical protein
VDGWLLCGLLLGLTAVGAYLVLAARHSASADLTTAARLFVAAILVSAGVKLAYLAVSTDEKKLSPFEREDRLYIVIGALTMIWVAAADAYRELKSISAAASQ